MVALASTNLAAYRAWTASATVKRATLINSAMDEIAKLNGGVSPSEESPDAIPWRFGKRAELPARFPFIAEQECQGAAQYLLIKRRSCQAPRPTALLTHVRGCSASPQL